MTSTEVLKAFASRANEAELLIKLLRSKISTVRTSLLANVYKNEEHRLQEENEKYMKEIETLKHRLTDLQKKNGSVFNCSSEVKNHIGAEVKANDQVKPAEAPKTDAPVKKEKKAKGNKENKGQNAKKQNIEEEVPVDIRRLDLRVGKILTATKHPDADSLYVEKVDVGEAEPRTVVSGLVKFIPIEQMSDRYAVLLCNLKPAKMRGVTSQAMVMCASTPDKVEILNPPEGSIPGELVEFEGYPKGVADTQLNPKKKIWEAIAPELKTNDDKVAVFKGIPFKVGDKGFVTAQTLANVQVK